MRSWLLYILAGLIEIHTHMKYQLATINRSWDSTLDKPTAAVLCPWARHFTPQKYWLITQEAVAPSRHDWKIVDWDVKPQHKQTKVLTWSIVRTYGQPERSMPPAGRGRRGIKIARTISKSRQRQTNVSRYVISVITCSPSSSTSLP